MRQGTVRARRSMWQYALVLDRRGNLYVAGASSNNVFKIALEGLEPDIDGDGLSDATEVELGFDPSDPDTDADGYCDGPLNPGGACAAGVADNCPAVANGLQTNSDGLPAGDACQCGNVDGTGGVTASDLQALREWIVGATPSGSAVVLDFCDVNDDETCDMADAAALQRFLEGGTITIETICGAYTGP